MIELSTYGILFFGTPHQGTDGFLREKAPTNIDSLSTYTSDIVLKDLGKDSEWLQQQLCQYTRISKGFVTKFFYETCQTSHEFSRKVVGLALPPILHRVLTIVGCAKKFCSSSGGNQHGSLRN